MKRWSKRFFSSTRGRVVTLLRKGEASVNDLADELDVTGNAIRAHLNTLQRDGLVRPSGKRSGVRKPETLFALTPEAEQLFPKAYHLLFNQLLSQLQQRLPAGDIEDILRATGRGLAQTASPSEEKSPRARAERAVEVLEGLGGDAALHEKEQGFVIRGNGCPLSLAVREHPEVCRLAEALLSAATDMEVHERCKRNGTSQCVFLLEQRGHP